MPESEDLQVTISLDEFAERQAAAAEKFGRYVKDVVEWAVYCPDAAPPDPHDYFVPLPRFERVFKP